MSLTPITLAAFVAMHRPDARDNPMVYSVWEDGEITREKGGDLFGQRRLHCISEGHNDRAHHAPIQALPMQSYGHGRILVHTYDAACEARNLLTV